MGKEVLKTYKFDDYSFTSFAYSSEDNVIYAITDRWLLVRIDCKSFEAQYIFVDSGQEYLVGIVANKSWCSGKEVVFVSHKGEKYIVYNIVNNTLREEMIKIDDSNSNLNSDNVLDLVDYGSFIYIFLRESSSVVKIEKSSLKVVGIINANFSFEKAKAVYFKEKEYLFFDRNRIAKVLNFSTEKFDVVDTGIEFENLRNLYSDNKQLYMLSSSGYIAKYSLSGNVEYYNINGKEKEFSIIVECGGKIWVFPSLGDNIYCLKNGEISIFEEYEKGFSYFATRDWFLIGSKFYNYIETEKYIYFPARFSNRIITLDKQNGNLTFHKISYSNKKSLIKHKLIEDGIVKEGEFKITLRDYIEFIY